MTDRGESLHFCVEDANTIDIAFLGMLAQQLLSHANTKNGLPERTDHLVKPMSLQIFHSATGFALTRKQHAVSLLQLLGIIRQ